MESERARELTSPARVWLSAVAAIVVVEALLNGISALGDADFSFSLKVSCARIVLMGGGFALFRVFRRDSRIWLVPLDFSRRSQRIAIVAVAAVLCVSLFGLGRISGQAEWLERGAVYEEGVQAVQDGNQYNHLADSFLEGKVELDLPQSNILLSMENPYDTPLRQQLNSAAHEPIYWDYAFYQGKYYCYFGALPCLLIFVPYKAITGCDLRTDWAVMLFACAMLIAGISFLYQLARTYFKELSLGAFWVGIAFLYCSSGVLEQVFLPRIYPVPILSALFFCFAGFAVLLRVKRQFLEGVPASKPLLALGALLVACTLGCRPQYVLTAMLIVAIFWPEIRARRFFSRAGLGNTIAVIAPFLIVAMPVCLYNQARFGSPFDFGASYNLTGADMTAYEFNLVAIVARAFEYLFLPPVIQGSYPFLCAVDSVAGLPAVMLTNESVFGGFFAFAPAALAVFALFGARTRRLLKARGVLGVCVASAILAAVILVVVSYVSGVTMRYFADFAYLIIIPATMVAWGVMADEQAQGCVRISSWLAALVFAGLPLYCWTFLATSRFGALVDTFPAIYYGAEALLRFL